jgi:streptogramin lyase
MWFVDVIRKLVGRITPSGEMTQFSLPAVTGGAQTIASGPDGNLWLTSNGGGQGQPDWILRVSVKGDVTKFQAGSNQGGGFGTGPESITAGPDGNVWFTEFWTSRIGRLTPSGILTEFPTPTPGSAPRGIVAGPDGNLWFTETNRTHVAIARVTPDGHVTEHLLTQGPSDLGLNGLVAGPDGNLWFTEQAGIGHISPGGEIVYVPLPQDSQPRTLAAGPDGNIWFTDSRKNAIARLSVAGAIREFPLPRRNSDPLGIAVGGDGRIWFTETAFSSVGSIGVKVPEVLLSRRVQLFADSSTKTVTVTNTGDATLAIASIQVAGVDKDVFTKSSDSCSGKSVAPGATCEIQLGHSAGGAAGLQSAFLEIADNATGTPQRISLVAQLRSCKLPVVVSIGPNSVQQGELLDTTTGLTLYDSTAGFEKDRDQRIRTTATPALYGQTSGYFDRAAGRWLPVQTSAWISEDGSRYAYTFLSADTRSQLHVVDVGSGLDRVIALPPDFWGVLAFTSRGIYVDKRYEGVGPGLWLVDPDSGALQQTLTSQAVDAVSGSAAWIGEWNAGDKLPQPPGMGGGHNQLVKRDLATGATTPWFFGPGSNVGIAAVVNGSPVVSVYDGVTTKYVIVKAPNQGQRMDFPFSTGAYPYAAGFVADPQGIWVGTADGVYLWSARNGGVLVSAETATPAGTCA